MTGSLIEAFVTAAESAHDASLIVASEVNPSRAKLNDVVSAGRRMGTRMMDAGVQSGDVIGVMLPNWREWMVAAVAKPSAM